MDWLQNYHEDHMAVLLLLAKLEGNILDLKAGLGTPNTFIEFNEFAEVIRNVIIPHFKHEESNIYRQVSETGPEGRDFIDKMIQEHNALYSLFDQFLQAVEKRNTETIISIGDTLEKVLRHHIVKEENDLPALLEG